MKLMTAVVVAFVCLGFLQHIHVHASSPEFTIAYGNHFYDECAVIERFATDNDEVVSHKAMFCLGYVEGLMHGVLSADIQHAVRTFCPPSEQITNMQAVRIVRKYIADHPAKAHELTGMLALEALRGAFPCR